MAFLPETGSWEAGIYQIEETDVVRGGPVADGGISNLQGQQLGNRTRYLYDRLGKVGGINQKTVSSDITLGAADLSDKILMLTVSNAGRAVTLDISDLPEHSVTTVVVTKYLTDTAGCLRIKFFDIRLPDPPNVPLHGGTFSDGLKDRLWLYQGEQLTFIKLAGGVLITTLTGNHDTVGEILYRPAKPAYAVELRGQLVNRADYPRLWHFAESNSLVIPDSQWLSGDARKGLFAHTNISTNFRLPDLRGVFIRSLDNGRGIDIDRTYAGEGIYQADEFKSHSHLVNGDGEHVDRRSGSNSQLIHRQFGTKQSGATGGIETRPKNIAYTAYMKF